MTPDEALLAARLASAAGLKPPAHNPEAAREERSLSDRERVTDAGNVLCPSCGANDWIERQIVSTHQKAERLYVQSSTTEDGR